MKWPVVTVKAPAADEELERIYESWRFQQLMKSWKEYMKAGGSNAEELLICESGTTPTEMEVEEADLLSTELSGGFANPVADLMKLICQPSGKLNEADLPTGSAVLMEALIAFTEIESGSRN